MTETEKTEAGQAGWIGADPDRVGYQMIIALCSPSPHTSEQREVYIVSFAQS